MHLLLDGRVPEDSGLGGIGRGAIFLAPIGLLPAGQDGHAVLLAEGLVWRFLPRFDLLAQMPFLLDHLHHGVVPTCPWKGGHLGEQEARWGLGWG